MSAHASLQHTQQMVRGEDAEHIKRHHGIKEETQVMHIHYSFDQDVTPELLEHFFNQLLNGQKSHHPGDKYITEDEVKEIVKAFSIFYADFKGSKLEKEFLEERELTKQEKESLVKHAKEETTSHLSKKDVSKLERCGFNSSEIPKPSEELTRDTLSRDEMVALAERGLIPQIRPTAFAPGFFQGQAKSSVGKPIEKLSDSIGFEGFKP